MTVYHLINGLAVIAASLSAVLWFWAARLKVDPANFAPDSVKQTERQSRLNRWAALATGFSAGFQAIGLMLAPSF
jgi:hypothetical protein